MFDTSWLHIGTEKTGTTALQVAFAANRVALARQGISYSEVLGTNHVGLAAYALETERLGSVPRFSRVTTAAAQAQLRAKLPRQLYFEAKRDTWLRRCHVRVLSNEHLHSRLHDQSELTRLRDLLLRTSRSVRVLVYLRPQHELAISLFSTLLRSGYVDPPMMPALRWPSPYYDYDRLLDQWSSVFGEPNILPRIYDASELRQGSIVDDALSVVSATRSAFREAPRLNEALSLETQSFLLNFNRAFKKRYGRFTRRLKNHGTTPGMLPSRRQVEECVAFFAESNERVRRRWFPERSSLFNIDTMKYPDVATEPTITIEQAFEIFARNVPG